MDDGKVVEVVHHSWAVKLMLVRDGVLVRQRWVLGRDAEKRADVIADAWLKRHGGGKREQEGPV